MTNVILAQVLVCIVQYYIATTEKTKNIFIVTWLYNVFNLLCYFLNDDMTTTYVYILICIRSFVYIYRDNFKKHKWHFIVPVLAIIAQLVVGFITMENYWQIIPIIIPCYVCYYMWYYDTTQKLRIGNIIGNGSWGIYNIATNLYIIAAGRIITVIMNIVAFVRKNKCKEVA